MVLYLYIHPWAKSPSITDPNESSDVKNNSYNVIYHHSVTFKAKKLFLFHWWTHLTILYFNSKFLCLHLKKTPKVEWSLFIHQWITAHVQVISTITTDSVISYNSRVKFSRQETASRSFNYKHNMLCGCIAFLPIAATVDTSDDWNIFLYQTPLSLGNKPQS